MSEYSVSNEFFVMTADTNDLCPLIYGRQLWGEMDKAAAICSRKYLKGTATQVAVTHVAEVKFLMPSYSGDVLVIKADVVSAHEKSIVIEVKVTRDKDLIAEGRFVFISIDRKSVV